MSKFSYTMDHKRYFLKVERELLGKNTIRGYLHDVDKLILYVFLPKKVVSKLHSSYSRHHSRMAETESDFTQMVIDWECARYTKPDKPLNARETLYKYYPYLSDRVLPVLEKYSL
jgi:hypothetical protein